MFDDFEEDDESMGATIFVVPDTRIVHVGLTDGERVLDLGDLETFEQIIGSFMQVKLIGDRLQDEINDSPNADLDVIVNKHIAILGANFN